MDSDDKLLFGVVLAWMSVIALAVVGAVVHGHSQSAAFTACVQAGNKPGRVRRGAMP